MLSNGARFYNDHAHPEYSTPECTTLRDIVAQDKAGERILAECARRRNEKLPNGHNRFAFTRTTLTSPATATAVTITISCAVMCPGTGLSAAFYRSWSRGKSSPVPGRWESKRKMPAAYPGTFQISQRADFFSVLVSIDTMNRRPLVNTRGRAACRCAATIAASTLFSATPT